MQECVKNRKTDRIEDFENVLCILTKVVKGCSKCVIVRMGSVVRVCLVGLVRQQVCTILVVVVQLPK